MLKSKIVFTMALSMVLMSSGIVNIFAAQYSPPWAHLHYFTDYTIEDLRVREEKSTYKLGWANGWVDDMGYNSHALNNISSYAAYTHYKSDSLFIFAGHGKLDGGGIGFWSSDGSNDFDGRIYAENTGINETNSDPIYYLSKYVWKAKYDPANEIDDTLVAMFMACDTALTHPTYGNLLDQARAKGVDIAIGWTDIMPLEAIGVFSMGFLKGARFENWPVEDQNDGYHAGDQDLMAYAYDYTKSNSSSYKAWNAIGKSTNLRDYVIKGQYGQRLKPARYGAP